mgnify:CR=1 FL=1
MLEEFAITPEIFWDDGTYPYLDKLLTFIWKYGMIADLNDGKALSNGISQLIKNNEVEGLSVDSIIKQLKNNNRIIDCPPSGDPQNPGEWLDLAISSPKKTEFFGVIASGETLKSRNLTSDPFYISFPEGIKFGGNQNWQFFTESESVQIIKSIKCYQNTLAPILRNAKKIHFIDPYFNCWEQRYINTINIIHQLLNANSQTQKKIFIHAGYDGEKNWFPGSRTSFKKGITMWRDKVDDLAKSSTHKFSIVIWKIKPYPNNTRFHDRYILTDQCGIIVPYGFDCFNMQGAETIWSMISNTQRVRLLAKFDEEFNNGSSNSKSFQAGEYCFENMFRYPLKEI